MKRSVLAALLVALSTGGRAAGQSSTAVVPQPAATIITHSELESAIARESGPVADAVLRVVPAAGGNVAVAVVRRSKVDGRTPPDAIVHEAITEVYHVIEGRGVVVTGGLLEGGTPLPPHSPVVQRVAGPSIAGRSIASGTARTVGPGDVVVIPPDTPHGFAELESDHITYLIVRIDPERRLQKK